MRIRSGWSKDLILTVAPTSKDNIYPVCPKCGKTQSIPIRKEGEVVCKYCQYILATVVYPKPKKSSGWSEENLIMLQEKDILGLTGIECPECGTIQNRIIRGDALRDFPLLLTCEKCCYVLSTIKPFPKEEPEPDHPESLYPDGKIIRLTNRDRLALEASCPYCRTEQTVLANVANYRPVGTLVRCVHCELVWRLSIHLKNTSLPEQEVEWRQMRKKGWRKPKV